MSFTADKIFGSGTTSVYALCLLALLSIFLIIYYGPRLNIKQYEGYSSTHPGRKSGAYFPDPELNGFERPLWGPLLTVPSQKMLDEPKQTMFESPWCSPPLSSDTSNNICAERTVGVAEIPYKDNKI